MPNYWIASTPLENYEIAKRDLLWACKSSFKKSFSRLKLGDKLTFYLFGKKISGDFEIVSEAFSGKNNFKGGSFPINVKLKQVRETKLAEFTQELVDKLGFIKNKRAWSAYFRRPIYQLGREDFDTIMSVL